MLYAVRYRYVTWSAVLVWMVEWNAVCCVAGKCESVGYRPPPVLCCAVLCCAGVTTTDNSKLVLCCGLLWWCSITTVTTLAPCCSMLRVTSGDVSLMMT